MFYKLILSASVCGNILLPSFVVTLLLLIICVYINFADIFFILFWYREFYTVIPHDFGFLYNMWVCYQHTREVETEVRYGESSFLFFLSLLVRYVCFCNTYMFWWKVEALNEIGVAKKVLSSSSDSQVCIPYFFVIFCVTIDGMFVGGSFVLFHTTSTLDVIWHQ